MIQVRVIVIHVPNTNKGAENGVKTNDAGDSDKRGSIK